MWVTSQAGGNMTSSTEKAMTAPGSVPVDPLPDRAKQGDPTVTLPEATKPGEPDGRVHDGYQPSPVSWKKVTDG